MRVTRRGLVPLTAALALAAAEAAGQARQRLLLVTGAAGGAFHEYGPLLAGIVAAHAPVDLDVQPSAGSNDNVRALARGDADLGLVAMGPAFDARAGRPPFKADAAYDELRALVPMYDTPFSLVALRGSGITRVSGLKGRKVGVGPAGGPGELYFKGLAKAHGLAVTTVTGSPSELAGRVMTGEIDAFWFGAGVPVAAFVEVLERSDAVMFGLAPEEVRALRAAFPYFAPAEIPAGIYPGQGVPIATASVWNFVLATSRLPDEIAYAVTAAVLDHAAGMAAAMPAASGTRAANVAADTFLPLHPGALRYYRERNVTPPAGALP